MRFGERLILEQLISHEQLDEALRLQLRVGCRVGSALVKLGYVELDELSLSLGRHYGMPAITATQFEQASKELQDRLTQELALCWGAIPVGRLLGENSPIAVAVMDPLPTEAVDQLSEALGGPVVLALAPEISIQAQLEQVYQAPPGSRVLQFEKPSSEVLPRTDEAQADYSLRLDVPGQAKMLAAEAVEFDLDDVRDDTSMSMSAEITSLTVELEDLSGLDLTAEDLVASPLPGAQTVNDMPAIPRPPHATIPPVKRSQPLPPKPAQAASKPPAPAKPQAAPKPPAPKPPAPAKPQAAPAPTTQKPPAPANPQAAPIPAAQKPAAQKPAAQKKPAKPKGTPPATAPRPESGSAVPQPIAAADSQGFLGRIAIKRRATAPIIVEEASLPRTFEEALRAMRKATDRDYLGDQVVVTMRDFLAYSFDVGAILVVREAVAIGWKGFKRDGGDSWVSAVTVPLDIPSVLHHSYQQRDVYVGPPPDNGHPIDHQMWTAMGGEPPALTATVPVVIEDEIVCLLYLQSTRPGQFDEIEDICGQLGLLARATAKSFIRLIRAAQR